MGAVIGGLGLPAAEGQIAARDTGNERLGNFSSAGGFADRRECETVSHQPISVECDPLTGVRRRLLGELLQFGAPVDGRRRFIRRWGAGRLFDGQAHMLVFGRRKRLERAEDPVLVNGVQLPRHDRIVSPGNVEEIAS